MSRLTVIGAGYVGLVTAACMAEIGHEVIGMDVDEERVRRLNEGRNALDGKTLLGLGFTYEGVGVPITAA